MITYEQRILFIVLLFPVGMGEGTGSDGASKKNEISVPSTGTLGDSRRSEASSKKIFMDLDGDRAGLLQPSEIKRVRRGEGKKGSREILRLMLEF